MAVVNTQAEARLRIIHSPPDDHNDHPPKITESEYFGMGMFVAVFLLFCVVCVIFMLKWKWRHRERQLSMTNLAKQMIARLDTRQYRRQPSSSSSSTQPRRGATATALSSSTPGGRTPAQASSDSSTVQSSNSESCAICLEGYREAQVLRVLPCHHEFHQVCVDPWLENHGTCPLCKIHIAAGLRLAPEDLEDVVDDNNHITDVALAFHPLPHALELDSDPHHHHLHHHHQHQHYRPHRRSPTPSSARFSSLLFPHPAAPSVAPSQRSSRQASSASWAQAPCSWLHLFSSGRRVVRTTCPSCECTAGSSPSEAGSCFKEAAPTTTLTFPACGSSCSRGCEGDPLAPAAAPHEYSGFAPPLLLPPPPPQRRGFWDYTDVRSYAGSTRDLRNYVTSRRDVVSGRRNPTAAAVSCREGKGSGYPGVIRPIPLSPCVPYHSGVPFTPAVASEQHVCGDSFGCGGHRHQVYPGHAVRLYASRIPSGGVPVYETQQDKWGSLRTFSVTAMRGSGSSSDPYPSDSSADCDCCCRGRGAGDRAGPAAPDSNLIDSNRSTYGSTDPKDSSDVSSYDSRVYQAKESGSRREERERRNGGSTSPVPLLPPPPPPRSLAVGQPVCPTALRKSSLPPQAGVSRELEAGGPPRDKVVVVHEGEEEEDGRSVTATEHSGQVTGQVKGQVTGQVKGQVGDDDSVLCDTCSAQGSTQDIQCAACASRSQFRVLPDRDSGDRARDANCELLVLDIPHEDVHKTSVEKRARRRNKQDLKPSAQGLPHEVEDVSVLGSGQQEDSGPLLFTAKPPRPRLPHPGDHGVGHRRSRSASCRRHHSNPSVVHRGHSAPHPRPHHPHNTHQASSSSKVFVHTPKSRVSSAPSSSSRHGRPHHGPHTSSSSSQRPQGHFSGSSRRTANSRRYQWAVEHLAAIPSRHHHHHPQHPRHCHDHAHCDLCPREQALWQATPQLFGRVGGSGGGGCRGDGAAPRLMSDSSRGPSCRKCHRRSRFGSSSAVPKHSMVLFREPEGAVVTIPLGDTDHYQPVNGV